MNRVRVLHAFAGVGIELEYMIVDRRSLSVLPISDALLRDDAGVIVAERGRGHLAWSNEVVAHVIEIKNLTPDASLDALAVSFQAEVDQINGMLAEHGACLMPGAMHPWMDPRTETFLWRHHNAAIYAALDDIFDCRQHGMANLQSMHVNLPFGDAAEFARLHAAVRLVVPILPALAASSPIADGRLTGYLDYRMEVYRAAGRRFPSMIGRIVPETLRSRAEFAGRILAPMYRDFAVLDPRGTLRHEWLNGRGAIPRFDRRAIEIRVIDMQECPQANIAVAAAACAAVRLLYDGADGSLDEQQAIATAALADTLSACVRDGDQALIEQADYLRLLGFPERRCRAGELWRHLIDTSPGDGGTVDLEPWRAALRTMLEHGPLARRILRALGGECSRERLEAVYGELCACLEQGRMFEGPD